MEATKTFLEFELDNKFPDTLYLLKHTSSNKYACYCHNGIHGLACFSNEDKAFMFAEWIDLPGGMSCEETNFDDARETAKERPMPIISLMLCDNLENPEIHYVR